MDKTELRLNIVKAGLYNQLVYRDKFDTSIPWYKQYEFNKEFLDFSKQFNGRYELICIIDENHEQLGLEFEKEEDYVLFKLTYLS